MEQQTQPKPAMTGSRKLVWTLGNLLMLVGVYLILFVGGLMADERYQVYAASGANDEVAPIITNRGNQQAAPAAVVANSGGAAPSMVVPAEQEPAAPTATPEHIAAAPTATPAEDAAAPAAPSQEPTIAQPTPTAVEPETAEVVPVVPERSTITRIVIPEILVDRKVIEIGWSPQQDENGQVVATWDVDQYRVGHHKGSSNPGGGSNIVLSGHSGGPAYPFNDIFYLQPGHLVQLYTGDHMHDYIVTDHILVDEVGQPLEKRRENARYIEPTDEEMVTMVACWPLSGPDRFKQRIIIRAKPADVVPSAAEGSQ